MQVVTKSNSTFKEVFHTNSRYILLWGGRGRGGSFFGTDYFLHLITQPYYFRGYFMREIQSDIRQSLYQDFKDRLDDSGLSEDGFNISDHLMKVEELSYGNVIESKGFKKSQGSQTAKMKSIAGATHILIEEAEEIGEDDFKQLDDSVRTTKAEVKIILLFNPPHKDHWIIKRWFNLEESDYKGYYNAIPKDDHDLLAIHSTYEDNIKNLNESTIFNYAFRYKQDYEKRGDEYYPINVLGLVSEGKKGRVFQGCKWKRIDAMPGIHEKKYCLDFGFGGDPLSLIEREAHNNKRYYDELIHETGITNYKLSERMMSLGISKQDDIIADSAEAKSIQELRDMGWNVIPAEKGPGSINAGINKLRSLDIHVTEDSSNIWKEYENYTWKLDRNKNPTDSPIDDWNHAMDGMRYGETEGNKFRLI